MQSLIVIERFAFIAPISSLLSAVTEIFANSGIYFSIGSHKSIIPRSTKSITAAAVTGLVIE